MYFLTQFIRKLAGEGSFNVVNEAGFTSYVLASKEKIPFKLKFGFFTDTQYWPYCKF